MSRKLSIIIPCYFEEETIPLFYKEVEKVKKKLNNIELEYWFVNDGSTDNTLDEIKKLYNQDPEHVHYIDFSRNFGKEAALYAGLQHATGEYVTVMDADLQDPPSMLLQMLEILEDEELDYDCVGTRRTDREGEPLIRSFFAKMFYKLINKISDASIVDGARDFRLMKRYMVDAILSMTEYNRFSKGIFSWVGFKTKYLEYENRERVAGNTSWSFWSLLKYSIDGIIDFSQAPLDVAVYLGLLSSIVSGLGIIFVIARYLIEGGGSSAYGWASLICVLLFIGGIQLLCLGIVGKYIGKIFAEVKNRPVYIVREKK